MVIRPRAEFGPGRVLVALLALALLSSLYFRGVLFGGQTFSAAAYVPGVLPSGPVDQPAPPQPRPMRDPEGAAWVDEPAPWIVNAAINDGQWPLWNAREGLGMPLLGNPNAAVLSPFAIAVGLAPSSRLQDLAWWVRVLVLGIGTVLLAREWGFGPLAALGAGVAIAFSGQTVQWIEHHPLNVDAFVPLALAAALGLRRGAALAGPLLALAVAAGCLGLKPQSALVAAMAGVVWLFAAGGQTRTSAFWARLVGWTLLGLGMASIALVPFWESWTQASGLVGAGRQGQSEWTLPVGQLVSLAGPWTLPDDNGPMGLPWAGVSVLALAFWGTLRGRREGLVLVWAATALVYLARIFGGLPVPLADVPLLGSVQWIKYSFPLFLALALLAARGVESLSGSSRYLACGLIGVEMFFLVPQAWPDRADPYAPAPWVETLRDLERGAPGRISGPVWMAPPLISGALGFRDLRSIDVLTPGRTWEFVQRTIAPSEGVTWVLADPDPLLAATGPGGPSADLRWILSSEPLADSDLPSAVRSMSVAERTVRLFSRLQGHRISTSYLFGGRTRRGLDERFHWICETPCTMAFDLDRGASHLTAGFAAPQAADVEASVAVKRQGRVLSSVDRRFSLAPDDGSWRDLQVELASPPEGVELEISVRADRAVRVFVGGVGLSEGVAAERSQEDADLLLRQSAYDRLRLRHAADGFYIYERMDALGAAYFSDQVVSVASRDALYPCLRRRGGATACVLGDPLAGPGRDAQVRIVEDRANSMRLMTQGGGGLLVVSRLAAEGFSGSIGGERLPMQEVNGALLGFGIPPGDHEVEIAYQPRSVRWGLWGSGISLILWMFAFWWVGFAHGARRQ